MNKLLISWITLTGITDFIEIEEVDKAKSPDKSGLYNLLEKYDFNEILFFYQKKKYGGYINKFKVAIANKYPNIKIIFEEVLFNNAASDKKDFISFEKYLLPGIKSKLINNKKIYYFYNAGTIEMRLYWFLLSESVIPGVLIKSDSNGISEVSISSDFKDKIVADLVKSINELKISYKSNFNNINDIIKKVSKYPYPIMLFGETGTGKTYTAEEIHKQSGRQGKFIPVNCGAIPENLIESTLFGIIKGTATGVDPSKGAFLEANNGTLFLDEIGDLPYEQQVKLLKVIGENKVIKVGENKETSIDVLIITGTNKNINSLILSGKFRSDLYFRLNITSIYMPPLREKKDSIPELVKTILYRINNELSGYLNHGVTYKPKLLEEDALIKLQNHNWPGNIRELENVIKRSIINMDLGTEKIKAENLIFGDDFTANEKNNMSLVANEIINYITSQEKSLENVINEIKYEIVKDLSNKKNNQSEIASFLQCDQSTISKTLKNKSI